MVSAAGMAPVSNNAKIPAIRPRLSVLWTASAAASNPSTVATVNSPVITSSGDKMANQMVRTAAAAGKDRASRPETVSKLEDSKEAISAVVDSR